jgi:myo-inositol 2-dehydrogenase/D-chiro-inositol 1-dehydrogenase
VALIGAGRMGAIHGGNAAASRRFDLVSVIDRRPEAAARLAAQLGCVTASLEGALVDPELTAVIVASSTDSHLPIVLAALAAGKAVFCEKPLDRDLAQLKNHADRFQGGPPLYVAFNRRFDPHFQALKAKVASGAIGALETANLISLDPRPPPPGFVHTSGGLFRDFTIHDFDVARWLFEEEPAEVFAFASCLVDPAIGAEGDVDTARTVLRFPSGRLCAITNSRRSGYGYDQRVEAFGSGGAAMMGNPPVSTLVAWTEAGLAESPIFGSFQSRYADSYRAELEHFADVLEKKAESATGFDAAFCALALAEAAAWSVASGKVVRIDEL